MTDETETTEAETKPSWNNPCCEQCWIDREGTWDEQDGEILIGLRLPVRMMEPPVERCSFCGNPTFIGIYVRVDPRTVRFPAEEPA